MSKTSVRKLLCLSVALLAAFTASAARSATAVGQEHVWAEHYVHEIQTFPNDDGSVTVHFDVVAKVWADAPGHLWKVISSISGNQPYHELWIIAPTTKPRTPNVYYHIEVNVKAGGDYTAELTTGPWLNTPQVYREGLYQSLKFWVPGGHYQ